jgi:hypothetical protein
MVHEHVIQRNSDGATRLGCASVITKLESLKLWPTWHTDRSRIVVFSCSDATLLTICMLVAPPHADTN